MKILVTSLPDLKKIPPQRPHHLLKYLSQKHEVTVLCVNAWWLKERQDNYLKDALKNIKIFYLSEQKINPVFQELSVAKNFNTFCNKFNRNAFDVHLNFNSLIAGYFIAKKTEFPTVFDVCDDIIEWIGSSPQVPSLLKPAGKIIGKFLLNKNIKLSRKITYTTESLKNSYNLPPDKSILIPNGVDTELFNKRKSQKLKEQLGISETDFVLGFVGFLGEWVELESTFIVVRKLIENHLKAKIIVVGSGDKFITFKDLARKYKILDYVIFTGDIPYSQVPEYISCMDICLLPFKDNAVSQNALPLKLFEYMACEKPAISTPLIGVREAVGNSVFYASNVEELEERILALCHNEELRRKMGQEGREFVIRNYSWDKICNKFEKVLIEAVESR